MISPWNLPMGTLWGQPWHGRYSDRVLTLPDATTLTVATWPGTDCHLMDFGLPGPDVVWQSEDGRQQLWRRAILTGRYKRYSPVSSSGEVGIMSWLYRASDGAVWRLTAVPTTGLRWIGGQNRRVIASLAVTAQSFGLLGASTAPVTTVATRAVADLDDLSPYDDATVYSQGWPNLYSTWIVNGSPAGTRAALNVYFLRTADFGSDRSGLPQAIFVAIDLCWQATVSGGSASAAPTVELSFVGSAATLGGTDTTSTPNDDLEIRDVGLPYTNTTPHWVWPADPPYGPWGDTPTLDPGAWPAGCSWTLDVQNSGANDRTLTIGFTATTYLASTSPVDPDTHEDARIARIALATEAGIVVLSDRHVTDVGHAPTRSCTGGEELHCVLVQHRDGETWTDVSTDVTTTTAWNREIVEVHADTTEHWLYARIDAAETLLETWSSAVTATSTWIDLDPEQYDVVIDDARNGQALDPELHAAETAPASLIGLSSGYIRRAEALPLAANNCLAYAVPWVSGSDSAYYVVAFVDASGVVDLAAPALAGTNPVEYARGRCSLNPITRTLAVGDRVGWI